MKILWIIVYVFFSVSGLFLMKLGSSTLFLSFKDSIELKFGLYTLFGFVFYIISFLLWQKLLMTHDLTYIVPITTGIIQILILLGGIFLFNENISIINLIGIVLTIIGIVLISIKK